MELIATGKDGKSKCRHFRSCPNELQVDKNSDYVLYAVGLDSTSIDFIAGTIGGEWDLRES